MRRVRSSGASVPVVALLALLALLAGCGGDGEDTTVAAGDCESVEDPGPVKREAQPPKADAPTAQGAVFETNCGSFTIAFDDRSPKTAASFQNLVEKGFYDGVIFHRVIDGFMAQTGDPTGTGTGGSQLPDIAEEFNRMPHVRGTVSMARAASEDSANSQFFIVFYPRLNLDNNYTNFGRVISNMAAVDAIQRGEPPANPTRVLQASIAADNKPVPAMPAPQV